MDMATHYAISNRLKCITWICENYPKIHLLPETSQTFQEVAADASERFMIALRTAKEHIKTARARLRRFELMKLGEQAADPLEQLKIITEKPYE